MEKGKRYASTEVFVALEEDLDGDLLYDPDKDAVPLADLYKAQETINFLENQVTDLTNFLQEKKKQIASLEKRNEKLFSDLEKKGGNES